MRPQAYGASTGFCGQQECQRGQSVPTLHRFCFTKAKSELLGYIFETEDKDSRIQWPRQTGRNGVSFCKTRKLKKHTLTCHVMRYTSLLDENLSLVKFPEVNKKFHPAWKKFYANISLTCLHGRQWLSLGCYQKKQRCLVWDTYCILHGQTIHSLWKTFLKQKLKK